MIKKITEAVNYIAEKGIKNPEVGIILGTGLGSLVDYVDIIVSIDYKDIPYFPVSTVESHSGKLIYGILGGKRVLVMSGRFHFYEGYSMQEITFPVRVMKMLGINTLLVSNASGALNLTFEKGSLMIIDDHINMLPGNPLAGKNIDELGPRFPDMSMPYDSEYILKMEEIAGKLNIKINKGIYVAWMGPNLETRAEYRMLKLIGADTVGMSTVPEVIVANHMKMRVAAVSVITDHCDPDNLVPVDISDIIAFANKAENDLVTLFKTLIENI